VRQPIKIAGSEVTITRIGFGCARIYGCSELKVSARLIEAALTAGIRHFDTAPSYGGGESESVLGELLVGMADVTISTKIGIPRPHPAVARSPARVVYRRIVRPALSHFPRTKSKLLQVITRSGKPVAEKDSGLQRRKLSRDEVLRGLEDSIKKLKRSFLDLYLLHEPDQFIFTDELSELFCRLQRDRVIGAFGLAYGRVADASPAFGTVIQGRHAGILPARSNSGHTRIFHGVLRHSWREPCGGKGEGGPTEYLGQVLATHPDAAVIFSASSPSQIRQVTSNLLI
jgi:aryl-alcohol dehydrogenase-like predicted oxidoreductase